MGVAVNETGVPAHTFVEVVAAMDTLGFKALPSDTTKTGDVIIQPKIGTVATVQVIDSPLLRGPAK